RRGARPGCRRSGRRAESAWCRRWNEDDRIVEHMECVFPQFGSKAEVISICVHRMNSHQPPGCGCSCVPHIETGDKTMLKPPSRSFFLRRRWLARASAAVLAWAGLGAAWAQADFPNRTLKLVVPFAAGGSDVMARAFADKLGAVLKQPVIVENRPGGA